MTRGRFRYRDPDGLHKKEHAWPIGSVHTDGDTTRIGSGVGGSDRSSEPDGLMVNRTPLTPLQALMEAAPHQEPEADAQSLMALREVIQDAIDKLNPRHRWVFDAHVNRGMGFGRIAKELSAPKSSVHRWYGEAQRALAALLVDHPLVAEHLARPETTFETDPEDNE